jgi:hypothetical protein
MNRRAFVTGLGAVLAAPLLAVRTPDRGYVKVDGSFPGSTVNRPT